jgi:hypothetical protein
MIYLGKKWGVLVKSGGVLVKSGGVLTCCQYLLLLCIFNPLCKGTIRQYVEQVLRLWTVLAFPSPLEFSYAHIYSVVLTHTQFA